MTLKTDKPIAEQRLEWAIAQLRHLNTTSNIGAVNRVIAALEEGQAGILSALATVEAERDEAVNAIAEANASDIGQLLATHQDSIVRAVNRADAAEARAEALARAVKEWQEARRAFFEELPAKRHTMRYQVAEAALLALDVQESS